MIKKIKATKKELFYDRFSSEWENKINNTETAKRINVVFKKLFEKHDLKSKTLLEVGCGMGYFCYESAKFGAKVTGIDIGPNLVKISKQKVPAGKFLVASASDLPFKNHSFETLLSTEVIEHVENQSKAIKEMARVVKPGGVLVITTPNKIFKPFFDFLSRTGIRPYQGNEKWIYPWELKEMLEKEKLKVVKEYFFNFIYPMPLFDLFENLPLIKYLSINYGFKLRKV
jgi:2-polyprenyl-3-methyl-5-hydroxy-6-metoxy-1,4-benzoquinol methylase